MSKGNSAVKSLTAHISSQHARPQHTLRHAQTVEQFQDPFTQHESPQNSAQIENIQLSQHLSSQHRIASSSAATVWTDEFATFNPAPQNHDFKAMEHIFLQNQANQNDNWMLEFQQQQQQLHNDALLNPEESQVFEQAFNNLMLNNEMSKEWNKEFDAFQAEATSAAWIDEFVTQQKQEDQMPGQPVNITASRLVDILSSSTNPKFQNSKFLSLMGELSSQRLIIQDDKLVPGTGGLTIDQVDSVGQISEYENEVSGISKKGDWGMEFQQQQQSIPLNTWNQEFQQQQKQNYSQESIEWKNEFANLLQNTQEHQFDTIWNSNSQKHHDPSSKYNIYNFSTNNIFSEIPLEQLKIRESSSTPKSLVENILLIESIIQRDHTSTSDELWYKLGILQQENENDVAAISAFRKCNINQSRINLAVSYANEGMVDQVPEVLKEWIVEKYGSTKMGNGNDLHSIVGMFLNSVRDGRGDILDADLQIGLGILFHVSGEFDKSVDCFETALSVRPQDYLLWNKLGATLANASPSSTLVAPVVKSLDAYYNALEINPTFIRARFNLAISCIQLNQYQEAVEHLLKALYIQGEDMKKVGGGADSCVSENVWRSLKMVLDNYMNKPDLAQACDRRDLSVFKEHFEF